MRRATNGAEPEAGPLPGKALERGVARVLSRDLFGGDKSEVMPAIDSKLGRVESRLAALQAWVQEIRS